MRNVRLHDAMKSVAQSPMLLSQEVGVDPKTVERWLDGRTPHPRHRQAIAKALATSTSALWPSKHDLDNPELSSNELAAVYAHRADVPTQQWWAQLSAATNCIEMLGYAMLFLHEAHPRLSELLRRKSSEGCAVRILLGDPESPHVAYRDEEEQLGGGLQARVKTSMRYFRPLHDAEGVELAMHSAPLYNSLFRFDDEMFVTPHLYGAAGYGAPLLHLRRIHEGAVFDVFAGHFDAVWGLRKPIAWPA